MNKKPIVIDLDGTLLDKDNKLSPRSASFLASLRDSEYMVILSSGRPWRAMKDIYEKCGCTGPVICHNGGLVFNPSDFSFPSRRYSYDKQAIRELRKRLGKLVYNFECESDDAIYLERIDPFLDQYFPRKDMAVVVGPIEETLKENVYVCLLSAKRENDAEIEKICNLDGKYSWRHWSDCEISELYFPYGHKGSALDYILDFYDIDKSEVIAFGDSLNDLHVLEMAGTAYAMKGSKSRLLSERFDSTIEDSDHDGVIATLERIIRQ